MDVFGWSGYDVALTVRVPAHHQEQSVINRALSVRVDSHDLRPSASTETKETDRSREEKPATRSKMQWGPHVPEIFDDDVTRAYLACSHLSTAEKLNVFAGVWLAVANQARTEALGAPGGFPAERARQVAMLQRCAEAIAADEPDHETGRLYHAGYIDSMLYRVRQQHNDLDAASLETKP